jgi:hypothetical protein
MLRVPVHDAQEEFSLQRYKNVRRWLGASDDLMQGGCAPNAGGELIGLYPRGAEPMRLYAAPLVPQSGSATHPVARVDFFDAAGRLRVADGPPTTR